MPDNNSVTDPGAPMSTNAATSDPSVDVNIPQSDPVASPDPAQSLTPDVYADVAAKISDAHNVLIALSSDPSVDEMAAAIGLSLYLDRLGKRATAIYSGATPNALEFLKPEDTFESSADTLQDFVIALNKDKADHLRYKLDGDYVKIYITPYKTRIAESDLDFSYGDYNVDLVLALDVSNGIDLDSALREHGRIMHNAVVVNITSGNPGKFGEIEWSDKSASSVSEMVAKLLYSIKSDIKMDKEEATAFLTGIVAATNRFSNAKTSPETMNIASLLMESGANQQLVSNNITPDMDNEILANPSTQAATTDVADASLGGAADLKVSHAATEPITTEPAAPEPVSSGPGESPAAEENFSVSQSQSAPAEAQNNDLLDDLKAAEASLASAGAETTPDLKAQPIKIENTPAPTSVSAPEPALAAPMPGSLPDSLPEVSTPVSEPPVEEHKSELVIEPPAGGESLTSADNGASSNKYGQMLEEALASLNDPSVPTSAPAPAPAPTPVNAPMNPAAANAPTVAANPEINGVPEINYMPMPGEEVLPPPPAPPIDMSVPPASPVTDSLPAQAPSVATIPTAAPAPAPAPLGSQPVMQDQVHRPQATDPNSFKIPGA